jgi:hypothetical protein
LDANYPDPCARAVLSASTHLGRDKSGMMTEEDARLALLKTELDTAANSIRNMDSIIFQIKG